MSSPTFTTDGAVPLESVIASDELSRRQCRQPDHEAVNRALVTLAQQMAISPRDLLQTLAKTALALCQAHSSGISLLEEENGQEIFRWHAVAGQYAPHLWGITPRNFSPCGTVLDRDALQLMSHPDRHFRYLTHVCPRIVEALLIPFYLNGQPVGTIWVISHDETRQFDAEDARVLKLLGEFAAAAYQVVSSLKELSVARLNLERGNEAKAQLATIVESSEDAIISKDLTGTIQTWNTSAERIYGYSAQEAIGRSMSFLLASGQEDEEHQILDQIRHGQRVCHYEAVRVRKDGNPIHVSLTISPIWDRAGALIGASHVAREIGERRRLEAAKAQLAAIVESSEDAIISKDLTGTIQTWNASAERVYAYSPLEAVGRNITFLLPNERANEYHEILARLLRGERVEPFETIRVRKDGKPIEVSLTISPIRDPGGNIIGTSHIARDITEQKVLEEQARRSQINQLLLERVLSVQEEERCRIARELHDEAGQLLASLLVGLRTLEDFENLEDVKSKGRWLREITVQTMDEVGRIARGLHPMLLDDHGLGVALSRYVSDYTNTHNIAVNLIVGNRNLGNLSRAIQIGLYRILQEALTNVARHSGAKTVSIIFTYSGAVLEIAVSDDGCGFDTLADFVSAGHLGIQSMRERAAILGGTVRIASEGKGTQVLILLPLTEEDLRRFSAADER